MTAGTIFIDTPQGLTIAENQFLRNVVSTKLPTKQELIDFLFNETAYNDDL